MYCFEGIYFEDDIIIEFIIDILPFMDQFASTVLTQCKFGIFPGNRKLKIVFGSK